MVISLELSCEGNDYCAGLRKGMGMAVWVWRGGVVLPRSRPNSSQTISRGGNNNISIGTRTEITGKYTSHPATDSLS